MKATRDEYIKRMESTVVRANQVIHDVMRENENLKIEIKKLTSRVHFLEQKLGSIDSLSTSLDKSTLQSSTNTSTKSNDHSKMFAVQDMDETTIENSNVDGYKISANETILVPAVKHNEKRKQIKRSEQPTKKQRNELQSIGHIINESQQSSTTLPMDSTSAAASTNQIHQKHLIENIYLRGMPRKVADTLRQLYPNDYLTRQYNLNLKNKNGVLIVGTSILLPPLFTVRELLKHLDHGNMIAVARCCTRYQPSFLSKSIVTFIKNNILKISTHRKHSSYNDGTTTSSPDYDDDRQIYKTFSSSMESKICMIISLIHTITFDLINGARYCHHLLLDLHHRIIGELRDHLNFKLIDMFNGRIASDVNMITKNNESTDDIAGQWHFVLNDLETHQSATINGSSHPQKSDPSKSNQFHTNQKSEAKVMKSDARRQELEILFASDSDENEDSGKKQKSPTMNGIDNRRQELKALFDDVDDDDIVSSGDNSKRNSNSDGPLTLGQESPNILSVHTYHSSPPHQSSKKAGIDTIEMMFNFDDSCDEEDNNNEGYDSDGEVEMDIDDDRRSQESSSNTSQEDIHQCDNDERDLKREDRCQIQNELLQEALHFFYLTISLQLSVLRSFWRFEKTWNLDMKSDIIPWKHIYSILQHDSPQLVIILKLLLKSFPNADVTNIIHLSDDKSVSLSQLRLQLDIITKHFLDLLQSGVIPSCYDRGFLALVDSQLNLLIQKDHHNGIDCEQCETVLQNLFFFDADNKLFNNADSHHMVASLFPHPTLVNTFGIWNYLRLKFNRKNDTNERRLLATIGFQIESDDLIEKMIHIGRNFQRDLDTLSSQSNDNVTNQIFLQQHGKSDASVGYLQEIFFSCHFLQTIPYYSDIMSSLSCYKTIDYEEKEKDFRPSIHHQESCLVMSFKFSYSEQFEPFNIFSTASHNDDEDRAVQHRCLNNMDSIIVAFDHLYLLFRSIFQQHYDHDGWRIGFSGGSTSITSELRSYLQSATSYMKVYRSHFTSSLLAGHPDSCSHNSSSMLYLSSSVNASSIHRNGLGKENHIQIDLMTLNDATSGSEHLAKKACNILDEYLSVLHKLASSTSEDSLVHLKNMKTQHPTFRKIYNSLSVMLLEQIIFLLACSARGGLLALKELFRTYMSSFKNNSDCSLQDSRHNRSSDIIDKYERLITSMTRFLDSLPPPWGGNVRPDIQHDTSDAVETFKAFRVACNQFSLKCCASNDTGLKAPSKLPLMLSSRRFDTFVKLEAYSAIPAFVINLDRRYDRWKEFQSSWNALSVRTLRFCAYDGSFQTCKIRDTAQESDFKSSFQSKHVESIERLHSRFKNRFCIKIPESDVSWYWDSTLNSKFDDKCVPDRKLKLSDSERACAASHLSIWRTIAQMRRCFLGKSAWKSYSNEPKSVWNDDDFDELVSKTFLSSLYGGGWPIIDHHSRSQRTPNMSKSILKSADDDWYLIFEDDAYYVSLKQEHDAGFKSKLFYILNRVVPDDFDILYLGGKIPMRDLQGNLSAKSIERGRLYRIKYAWGLHAYILRGRAVDKILNALPINCPVDNFIAQLIYDNYLTGYALTNQMCKQIRSVPGVHDLGGSNIKHSGKIGLGLTSTVSNFKKWRRQGGKAV